MKKIILTLFGAMLLTGCMALDPDPTLLKQTSYAKPAIKSDYALNVSMNPKVERQASALGVTRLVQDSLKIALDNANIFTKSGKNHYKVDAYIEQASQATFSFGRFNGKLKIHYLVKTPEGNTVFEKSVYTEAGSDKWYFSGAMRHTRARIVNVSKNVNQFVQELNSNLRK
ncbi:MAG: hypothetical protein Q4A60_04965 [Pasteurellaceae bacterium]|nr:hypothetical protein [Pasteurellaceae bacterium]